MYRELADSNVDSAGSRIAGMERNPVYIDNE